MRLVAISDPHGQLPEIPECDVCVLSGDICPVTNHALPYQLEWLRTGFSNWIDRIPAKSVVFVAGNHDFIFQKDRAKAVKAIRASKDWFYLQDSDFELRGVKFFGSPWQPFFYDWAFNAPHVGGEEFLKDIYRLMPSDTDVVITHGPPWGGHPEFCHEADHTRSYRGNPREFMGSHALLDKIQAVRPKLVVCGHIHGGYGVYPLNFDGKLTYVANASVLNERYILTNDPLVFDISIGGDGRASGITQVTIEN